MVISRCCFPRDGKEMYQSVLLIKTTAGNFLTSVAKHTSKTIDYENIPLERVEKALSPLVQVKGIGQTLIDREKAPV